jgi:aerobic-type carbon monoxide dehydrogenase small subunit (CoxS/CutS family)
LNSRTKVESATRGHIELTVNGDHHAANVDARYLLVDFLRDDLRLTGTHISCVQGACGVCTVLINGHVVRSCLTLAVQTDGAEVLTLEGLANDWQMRALQDAFRQHHALQCGFCTPGFLVTAYALLSRMPDALDEEITSELDGVICRCTGYAGIRAAVLSARERIRSR